MKIIISVKKMIMILTSIIMILMTSMIMDCDFDELFQVRASTVKDVDSHYLWELIHLKSQIQRRGEKVYHLSNRWIFFVWIRVQKCFLDIPPNYLIIVKILTIIIVV